MNYSRRIITLSSFIIALLGGVVFVAPSAYASEALPSLINTAIAKEPSDTLTVEERVAILREIITASQDEITSFTDKLKGLKLDDQWSLAQEHFIDALATSGESYAKLSARIDRENISLEEVKAIAKDLKDLRELTYTPQLKEAGNLILIFQTEGVRTIIEARDTMIVNDIKKLDRQKLVNTDTLKKYLSQAEKSINNAKILTNKAKDLYFTASVAPLQPKDGSVLSEDSPAEEVEVIEDTTDIKDPQDEVRDLCKDSLKELKTAYELFFKMNDRIRK